jgi:8-oxo-dGTP pyrophosphatase MutT (NUDIX family)
MSPEIAFTCGFAVNESNHSRVLLIQKKRGPSFNIGKWNGLGGKIEVGETPRGCMAREFEEECGIVTDPAQWTCFHTETHLARAEQTLNPRIYFMTTKLDDDLFFRFGSMTDEPVEEFYINEYRMTEDSDTPKVYNLRYLLQMVSCWHEHPEHQWLEG